MVGDFTITVGDRGEISTSRLPMELEGFEPSTSTLPVSRAPNCATAPGLDKRTVFTNLATI